MEPGKLVNELIRVRTGLVYGTFQARYYCFDSKSSIFKVPGSIKIELATLFRFEVIGLALGLTFAAIIGKQVCSLGAVEKGLNCLAIGLGMVPRGEVGLIFAGVGLKLNIGGRPILNENVFAAILVMVIITTLLTPPLLQWSFSRRGNRS